MASKLIGWFDCQIQLWHRNNNHFIYK